MTQAEFQEHVLEELREIKREVAGELGYPGLRGRVQAVEQTQKSTQWWTRTAIGAAIGAAFACLGSIFGR